MRLRQKCGFDVHYVPGEENERKYLHLYLKRCCFSAFYWPSCLFLSPPNGHIIKQVSEEGLVSSIIKTSIIFVQFWFILSENNLAPKKFLDLTDA